MTAGEASAILCSIGLQISGHIEQIEKNVGYDCGGHKHTAQLAAVVAWLETQRPEVPDYAAC